VCVVGAGIVGCATAYQLVRDGHRVTLVDAAAGPGLLTSHANGAQLSYSYVEPLASPATLRALPSLLWPGSAMRFRPRLDWRQWAWGLRFLMACRANTAQRGTERLLSLAQLSRATLAAWMAEETWQVDHVRNGKLVLCPDEATLRRQAGQVALQAALGCSQQMLTAEQCRAREPALARSRARIAGGVWTADECVVDPYKLCVAMVHSLQQRGGTARFGTRVRDFVREGSRFVAARTDAGDIEADAFVLASGAATAHIAAGFGVHLAVYPIKGYSITLRYRNGERPQASVTDLGRKTVFAPLGDRLRVAAMAEVGGYGLDIPPARLRSMVDSVQTIYPDLCHLDDLQPWSGLRPAMPDSVPSVGQLRRTNMYLNVGHGALGLTLAAGSAARIGASLRSEGAGSHIWS
jgi:D-amino-acid dehydrogenase